MSEFRKKLSDQGSNERGGDPYDEIKNIVEGPPPRSEQLEAARKDYEGRRGRLHELAEERGILRETLVMTTMADFQEGLTNPGLLLDVKRSEGVRKKDFTFARRGKREVGAGVAPYGKHGSDWLRSLSVLRAAMITQEGVPGLIEVGDPRGDKWSQFSEWCQNHALDPVKLLEIKEALLADSGINLAEMSSFRERDLGRLVTEVYKDRLLVRADIMDTRYDRLSDTGLTKEPTSPIRIAGVSALHDLGDVDRGHLLTATFIESVVRPEGSRQRTKRPPGEGEQGSRKLRKAEYAYGVHTVYVDDLKKISPEIFSSFESSGRKYEETRGRTVETYFFDVNGGQLSGLYQEVPDEMTIREDLIRAVSERRGGVFSENKSLLRKGNAGHLYHRSGGDISVEEVTNFDLNKWYAGRLDLLPYATSIDDVLGVEDLFRLSLSDVVGREKIERIEQQFPECIPLDLEREWGSPSTEEDIPILYRYDKNTNTHQAEIVLDTQGDTKRAFELLERMDLFYPEDFPEKIGEPDNPPIFTFFVKTQAAHDYEREMRNYRPEDEFGQEFSEPEPPEFPEKTFRDIVDAVEYLDDAYEKYLSDHPPENVIPDIDSIEDWTAVLRFEKEVDLDYVINNDFPTNMDDVSEGLVIQPILLGRVSHIIPKPAISSRVDNVTKQRYFGIVLCANQRVADAVNNETRKYWEDVKREHEAES